MIYKDIVNNVLRRLREEEVSTVSETSYSTMIGDIVNDAKRQVEDSWDWSALRTGITVPTVSGTKRYSLTGSNHRITIIDATNDTQMGWMQQRSQAWGRQADFSNSATGAPHDYVVQGPDGSGDTQVDFYPTPDGVYTTTFNVVQRTEDFTDDADEMSIPHMPVIHLAFALAAREKGEVGGNMSRELFSVSQRILADAIAQDSAYNRSDLVWYTP